MNINRTGNKKQGGTFKCNSTTEITPQQMRLAQNKIILMSEVVLYHEIWLITLIFFACNILYSSGVLLVR